MKKSLLLFILVPAIALAQSPSAEDIHSNVKQESHSQLLHAGPQCCSKPPKIAVCGESVNPCAQLKRLRSFYLRSVDALSTGNLPSTLPSDQSLDAADSLNFRYGPQNAGVAVVSIGGQTFASATGEETRDISETEKGGRERINGGLPQSTASTSQPAIIGYSPLFGNPGTALTITGSNFGAASSNNYVFVLSAVTNTTSVWPASSWSDTQIVVSVPSTMPLGKVYLNVSANGVHSVGTYPFTVGVPPSITSYSPGYGNPGTLVTINGTGFGMTQGQVSVLSAVTNTWTNWPAGSWSDTQIIVPVPTTMPLGKVYLNVIANGLATIGTYPFTVGTPPSIISYSPLSGPPGTLVTINGSGFGYPQGSSFVSVLSAVTNTWTTWPTTAWSDTQIIVLVPTSMPLGKVYLSVTAGGLATIGTYPFTVGAPPVIECYSPLYGSPGTSVTINGSGFGTAQGSSFVAVLSAVTNTWTTWTASNWSNTQIVVSVPENMSLGKVYLNVIAGGLQSIGTYPFTVGIPPFITSYSPLYGNPGTILTIDGSGFGQTQGSSSYVSVLSAVTNTWTNWPVTNWTDTQLTLSVPSTMPLGKVYLAVTTNALASIGTYPFTVGIPPSITSYSPTSGPAGTIITIQGSGFGATQGNSFVTLQAITGVITPLTISSWSQNQIVASVPNLTPTCLSYLSVTVGGLGSIGTYPFTVR